MDVVKDSSIGSRDVGIHISFVAELIPGVVVEVIIFVAIEAVTAK